MSVQDYEQSGGFKEELAMVRAIGIELTTLESFLPARPHSQDEERALAALRLALTEFHEAVIATRDGKSSVTA